MNDRNIRRLPSTTYGGDVGNHGLFSAGMTTLSPFAWDSLLPGGSRGQRTVFVFDEQTTSQWQRHEQDFCDGGTSKDGVERRGRNMRKKQANEVDLQDNKQSRDKVDVRRRYRTVDETQRQFKECVIRKLLSEFSLEETYRKYRSSSAKSYRINPADFSFDCAMSAQRLRDRLQKLTNSEVIKINDREFTDRVCQLLEEKQKEEMARDDRRRAEQEVVRLRRLMQNGVITAQELHNELTTIGAVGSVRKATVTNSKRGSFARRHTIDNQLPSINNSEQTTVQRLPGTSSSFSYSFRSGRHADRDGIYDGQSYVSRLSGTTNTKLDEHQPNAYTSPRLGRNMRHNLDCCQSPYQVSAHSDIGNGNSALTSCRAGGSQASAYVPPLMMTLREERKLGEMYRIADRLLYGRGRDCRVKD